MLSDNSVNLEIDSCKQRLVYALKELKETEESFRNNVNRLYLAFEQAFNLANPNVSLNLKKEFASITTSLTAVIKTSYLKEYQAPTDHQQLVLSIEPICIQLGQHLENIQETFRYASVAMPELSDFFNTHIFSRLTDIQLGSKELRELNKGSMLPRDSSALPMLIIQRYLKYPLLLKEIKKHAEKLNQLKPDTVPEPTITQLTTTIEQINQTIADVNEQKRKREEQRKTERIKSLIDTKNPQEIQATLSSERIYSTLEETQKFKQEFYYNQLNEDLRAQISKLDPNLKLHAQKNSLAGIVTWILARFTKNRSSTQYIIQQINHAYENKNKEELSKYLTMLGLNPEQIDKIQLAGPSESLAPPPRPLSKPAVPPTPPPRPSRKLPDIPTKKEQSPSPENDTSDSPKPGF